MGFLIDPYRFGREAAYKAAALALSPLRLWMFDETSGTDAADSSGNVAHLILVNGTSWSSGGVIGQYGEFDGSNDYADYIWGTSLTGEWSAVALVRVDTQGDRQIVGDWGTNGSTQKWILGLTASGLEVYSYNGGYSGFGASVTLTGGAWNLVGVSRRAGTNASNLYVNGASIGVGTVVAPNGGSRTRVGYKQSASTYFDGGICGVAVFNAALTTAQHLTLAQAAGLA